MAQDAKKRVEQLRAEIRRHDYLYYVLARPEISDRQYDKLFSKLKRLEQQHPELVTSDSPTQRVSGEPLAGFATVRHASPMLSMDNTYNADELRAFDERVAKGLDGRDYDYVVELKIDGVAIALRYQAGALVTGATRGDGRTGDDVTANVRTIKAVPLSLLDDGGTIPDVLEVRGEVYMPTNAFVELNKLREQNGEPPFANPRNATAGSLKLLDSRITAQRNLSFFAYAVGQTSEPLSDDHYQTLQRFKKLGLPVNHYIQKAADIEEALRICDKWDHKRKELDYQIDGMVIKVNRFDQRDLLGSTGRAPRWCISYKFAAEQTETVVESIDVQVGKSGILTPVANLTPVFLSGTTVSRASLHNFDEMERLDVRQGDTVIIEKAGEIIPQVIEVKKEKRPRGTSVFKPPSKCPNCGGPVQKNADGVYIRCLNPGCLGRLKERIKYFAGRGQMDIDHLGEALIDQLIDTGLVKDFADIYKLTKEDLVELERMADKSTQNVVDAIDQSKSRDLWRLIAALGIHQIGGEFAQTLASSFGSLKKIRKASLTQLTKVLAPTALKEKDAKKRDEKRKRARSVYDYFRDTRNKEVIDRLLRQVKPKSPQKANMVARKLGGKVFVVTGTLENFSRQQAKEAIRKAGGKASSSVSKNTDFVLAGESPGSKLDKARKLGIYVIDEREFLKLIQEEP